MISPSSKAWISVVVYKSVFEKTAYMVLYLAGYVDDLSLRGALVTLGQNLPFVSPFTVMQSRKWTRGWMRSLYSGQLGRRRRRRRRRGRNDTGKRLGSRRWYRHGGSDLVAPRRSSINDLNRDNSNLLRDTYLLSQYNPLTQVVRTNRDPYHIGCAFLARHLVNVFFLFVLHILEVCGRADHEHEGAQQHSQYHTYNRTGGYFFHRRQGHRVVCLLRQRHKGDIRLSNVCSRQWCRSELIGVATQSRIDRQVIDSSENCLPYCDGCLSLGYQIRQVRRRQSCDDCGDLGRHKGEGIFFKPKAPHCYWRGTVTFALMT